MFPKVLVCKSNLHVKSYRKLLTSQGKPLSLLKMDLRQKLYKYHALPKVTDAGKSHFGESQIDYFLVDC